MKPILVVALGGNALLKRGEALSAENQIKNAEIAAKALQKLKEDYRILLVHGNGPQVGLLALQNSAYKDVEPYSFDILGAESQGMIGYILSQQIKNLMPEAQVATFLTQVEVDPHDSSFQNPTKPIGPQYNEEEKNQLISEKGWDFRPDGRFFRRVVPSPAPQKIVEIDAIKEALQNDHLVIAGGGGGIPVVKGEKGYKGIEAVIDKDSTAALLARQTKADAFMILTDGDGIFKNFGKENQEKIDKISIKELSEMEFDPGSMAPKVQALMSFVKDTGYNATIGDLSLGKETMEGKAGTQITAF